MTGLILGIMLGGMTLRPPRSSASARHAGNAALDYEIAQEQVSALGRAGRALEAALAALTAHGKGEGDDARGSAAGTARAQLVQEASDALWCFIVQREAIGLRDPRPVIRDYRVPREVQNRMGAFGRR